MVSWSLRAVGRRVTVLAVAVDEVDAEVDLPPEGADGDGVAVRRLVQVSLQALVPLLADLAVSRHGLRFFSGCGCCSWVGYSVMSRDFIADLSTQSMFPK